MSMEVRREPGMSMEVRRKPGVSAGEERGPRPPRPRVVWLLDRLEAGGAERLALRYASEEPRAALIVLQPPRDGRSLEAIWGQRAIAPLAGRLHLLPGGGLADPSTLAAACRLVRRLRPPVVHAHLRYATIWGPWVARAAAAPLAITMHLGPPGADAEPAPGRERVKAGLERWARRRARRVVYVSEAQRAAWAAAWPRQLARERVAVVGNGVAEVPPLDAAGKVRLRLGLGLPLDAFVATTVAVVRAPKGWRTWLEMIARVGPRRPRMLFVWVGGGPEFDALRAEVAQHPVGGRIRLAGQRSDVNCWLQASDLFIFPSCEEAQPTAVLEAMAAGVPLVACRIAAVEEVTGGCGALVAPGSAAALATSVAEWSDPGFAAARAAAAETGRARVALSYGERRWRERLEELYAELTRTGGAAAPPADDRIFRPRRAVPL